nr:cis-zeatin O-glucosyltransferase 1-like [Coffea arabica]
MAITAAETNEKIPDLHATVLQSANKNEFFSPSTKKLLDTIAETSATANKVQPPVTTAKRALVFGTIPPKIGSNSAKAITPASLPTNALLAFAPTNLAPRSPLKKHHKQWAVGPFNPVEINEQKNTEQRQYCLEWLDKQGSNSVIFVCFGSNTSVSHEEATQIAIGLEKSGQKFIWILKDGDKGDIFKGEVSRVQLLGGFDKRTEGRGIIVRDWAPQLEILGHSSTGGFMSHCARLGKRSSYQHAELIRYEWLC